jgi:hypothetical protein
VKIFFFTPFPDGEAGEREGVGGGLIEERGETQIFVPLRPR